MPWGLLIPTLLGVAASLPAITLRQLPTKERVFVDPQGRQRLFHGANVVVKGPPWLPSRSGFDWRTSLVKEDFKLMREAGMNSMRLGVMWAGAEPSRGKYNETYFAQIKAIIEEAAEYGIYTFADMHQDAFSERFCGEGVPVWAVHDDGTFLTFPEPFMPAFKLGSDGFPTRQDCNKLRAKMGMNGQEGYATPALEMATQRLYQNYDGLADAWGLFFAKFATFTKGIDAVLGINLINEPFTGSAWRNPFRLLPSWANQMLLKGYDVVNKHVRQVNDDLLIFFPGTPWSDVRGHEMNDGFTHPPGGPQYANRSVLSFHYYEPPQAVDSEELYIGKVMLGNARRLETALFLTETWGTASSMPWGKSAPAAEAHGVSWSYWEWKDFCYETPHSRNSTSQWAAYGACKTGYGGGLFNKSGIKSDDHQALGRMYAYAIQGLLISHSYDAAKTSLTISYDLDPRIQGPTEVYAHPEWHGGPSKDFTIVTKPSGALTIDVRHADRAIHLIATSSARAGPVSVSIKPKVPEVETALLV